MRIAAEIVTALSLKDPSLVGAALSACTPNVGLTVLLHTSQGAAGIQQHLPFFKENVHPIP